MEPTLILTSKSTDDVPFAETAAEALGLPFRFLTQAEAIKHLNREACRDPIFFSLVSPDCVRWLVQSVVPRLQSKTAPVHPELVHILGSLDLENLRELADTDVFGSFVQRSQVGVKETALIYAELMRPMLLRRLNIKTGAKPTSKDAAPWGFQVRTLETKLAALRELEELLSKHSSYPPKFIEAAILTTDELLTRAYAGHAADEGGNPVEVSIVSKDDEIRVTVTDFFGAIKRAGFLSGILKDSSDPTSRGATKGLALIFCRGGSLSFQCVPGRSTQATAYFRVLKDYRGILEQTRFISLQGGSG